MFKGNTKIAKQVDGTAKQQRNSQHLVTFTDLELVFSLFYPILTTKSKFKLTFNVDISCDLESNGLLY